MSTFAVRVVPVTVEVHPDADALELARVGGYRSVVRKGQFRDGDLVAYIPEQAVLPPALVAELGLTGKLAGPTADRVKAIRLRGVLSQGLCLAARPGWAAGDDVTAELGVTKYEPPVPTALAGEVYAAGLDRTLRYDVENVKAWPDVLADGEPVVFTEKIHGTWCQIGVMPAALAHPEHGDVVVASKGNAARGLAFKPDAPANAHNLYLRVARRFEVGDRVRRVFVRTLEATPVFVLGEVFGRGVQDLAYGAAADRDAGLGFRVFDIHVGPPGQGRYLDDAALDAACTALRLPRVPVLWRGPFSRDGLATWTGGRETVSGRAEHVREGVVVRPLVERGHPALGRVQLKSVSEAYLLRKDGTEYT